MFCSLALAILVQHYRPWLNYQCRLRIIIALVWTGYIVNLNPHISTSADFNTIFHVSCLINYFPYKFLINYHINYHREPSISSVSAFATPFVSCNTKHLHPSFSVVETLSELISVMAVTDAALCALFWGSLPQSSHLCTWESKHVPAQSHITKCKL